MTDDKTPVPGSPEALAEALGWSAPLTAAELAQQAALPLLAETVRAEIAERIVILDEDPDGPGVPADPTPVRPGRGPAPARAETWLDIYRRQPQHPTAMFDTTAGPLRLGLCYAALSDGTVCKKPAGDHPAHRTLHGFPEVQLVEPVVPLDVLHDHLAAALADVGITYVPQQEQDPIYDRLARAAALVLLRQQAPAADEPPATDHFVTVEFDGANAAAWVGFICKAGPDAPCHMVCPHECESCSHKPPRKVDYCNHGEYIANGGDGPISQAAKQPVLTFPVDVTWNGDTYVWAVRDGSVATDTIAAKIEALEEEAARARTDAEQQRRSEDADPSFVRRGTTSEAEMHFWYIHNRLVARATALRAGGTS